jgi:hypothetical protein
MIKVGEKVICIYSEHLSSPLPYIKNGYSYTVKKLDKKGNCVMLTEGPRLWYGINRFITIRDQRKLKIKIISGLWNL